MPTQRKPRPQATVTVEYHHNVARPMAEAIAARETFPLVCIAKRLQKYADECGFAMSDQRVIGGGPEARWVEQRTWERALEDELRIVGHNSPQFTAAATIAIALLLDYGPRHLGQPTIISVLANEYSSYCSFQHLTAFARLLLRYLISGTRNAARVTNTLNLEICRTVLADAGMRQLTPTQLKRQTDEYWRELERQQIRNEIEAVNVEF